MSLDANQQLELEKAVTRIAYFIEFQFLTATSRVCSLGQTVTWGGYDWLGFGSVGSISPIDESQGTAASSLTFTLNIAQLELLSIATGNTNEYRGRNAVLYFCPLDENFRLVGTPVRCWGGKMDTMTAGIQGQREESTGSISLKCETSAYGLKRKSNLRLNAAQQTQRYPADTGLDYLTDLLGNPDGNVWLTKRFQQR